MSEPTLFERQKPYLMSEAITSMLMDSFTTGTLLIGIGLLLGASPLIIGVLGAMPFLANVLQIPAIFLVERYQNRRRIVLIASWAARSAIPAIAMLYFLPADWALPLFLILCAIRFGGSAISGCAWNSWMNDLIPKKELASFFGRRMFVTTIVSTIAILAASFFLQWWERNEEASIAPYSFLFGAAYLFAVISNIMIARLHHPPIRKHTEEHMTRHFTRKDLLLPLKHENFRALILFMAVWSFAVNLAAPFFTVFMISSLGYSMSEVILLTVITQVVYVIMLRIWSHYSDRFSNKTIIHVCGPVFAFCFLGWTFITFPTPHDYSYLFIVILHVLMGMATSGINLATNNIALKLCPDEHSTSYLATNSLFSSMSAGLAPLIGGSLITLVQDVQVILELHVVMPGYQTSLPTLALGGWDFFFFLAFLLSFAAMAILIRVQEEGEVHRKTLLRTLVFDSARLLQNVSTVAGLRAQTSMPSPESTSV
jgi:MFS family permease